MILTHLVAHLHFCQPHKSQREKLKIATKPPQDGQTNEQKGAQNTTFSRIKESL